MPVLMLAFTSVLMPALTLVLMPALMPVPMPVLIQAPMPVRCSVLPTVASQKADFENKHGPVW